MTLLAPASRAMVRAISVLSRPGWAVEQYTLDVGDAKAVDNVAREGARLEHTTVDLADLCHQAINTILLDVLEDIPLEGAT